MVYFEHKGLLIIHRAQLILKEDKVDLRETDCRTRGCGQCAEERRG